MLCRCAQTNVHVSEQMWVNCKAWQDCTERITGAGRTLLPHLKEDVGDGGHGGWEHFLCRINGK